MQAVSAGFTTACQAAVRAVQYKFLVKWDGTNWTDESAYVRLDAGLAGQTQIARPGEDLLQPGDVALASVVLENVAGRFSWRNSAGALYAYIGTGRGLAGHEAQIQIGFGGEYVVIFYGVIYRWRENSAGREVQLELRDLGWKYLQHRASTSLYTDQRSDLWLSYLATLAGVPATSLDIGLYRLGHCWLDDESILAELWAAAQADGGRCYFDELGTLRFENALHWTLAPHTVVQWTFAQANMADVAPDLAPDEILTAVVVEWQSRQVAAETTLYTLDQPRLIRPGETLTFEARLSQAAAAVTVPVANTDYVAVSTAGQDLSANLSVALPAQYAQRCQVSVANSHTTLTAHLTWLQIRGWPLAGGPTEQVSVATSSPALPSGVTRVRSVRGNQYVQLQAQATALAGMIAGRSHRLQPVYLVRNTPGVPHLELGDRVKIQDARTLSSDIEGYVLGWTWQFNGSAGYSMDVQVLDATYLYPYTNWFVIGTTALGAVGRAWH